MIDVDLRRYGTDKEYEEFINGYLSGCDWDDKSIGLKPTTIKMEDSNELNGSSIKKD